MSWRTAALREPALLANSSSVLKYSGSSEMQTVTTFDMNVFLLTEQQSG
jgi:hypothetical protein